MICRSYLKDIIELENRLLQLEKRISCVERVSNDFLDFKNSAKEIRNPFGAILVV